MKCEGFVLEVIKKKSKPLWWWWVCNIRHFCYDLYFILWQEIML